MYRRKLFYLSGFDPRGARFYHPLVRDGVLRHGEKTGAEVEVSPRRRGSAVSVEWTVRSPSRGVETACSFLRWDDLVGRAWIKGAWNLARDMASAYLGYARHLDARTVYRLKPGTLVTLYYPLLAVTVLPLLLAAAITAVLSPWLPWFVGGAIGLAVAVAIVRPLVERMRALWLVRLFIFNHTIARCGFDADTLGRLSAFAGEIGQALDEGHDEVLLVAHSNGTILAVPLLLELLRRRGGKLPEGFAFVSMGHCIPLLACRRDAGEFVAQLHELGNQSLRWIDIGSPPDGAAFGLVDPLTPARAGEGIDLTLLSPRFHVFYDPETYHSGWADKYEIHFDYLRCGDRVSPIDLPSLILADRPIDASVGAFKAIP